MVINIQQGTKDSKQEFLDIVEKFEQEGYRLFDIGSYDKNRQLAEAVLILEK